LNATIVLPHSSAGDSTTFTLTTSETIPSNIKLEIKNGAILDGAGTLTINGPFEAGLHQVFGSSISLVFGDLSRHTLIPHWFAADGWDGLDLAVTALEGGTGGTITLPLQIYDADKQITVSSTYPISIVSTMMSPLGAYIRPRAGIGATDALIRYIAPDQTSVATRSLNGGGIIRGLSFKDDSDLENVTVESRRVVEIGEALELYDFDSSVVENCSFHYINGSAIRVERSVHSTISGCRIHYCGDTGKPALNIDGQASGKRAQSFNVMDCRIEACFNDDYMAIDSNSLRIKLSNLAFESLSATAADASSQTFIDCDAEAVQIDQCHFNVCGDEHINISGENCSISNCIFDGDNENGRITLAATAHHCILNNLRLRAGASNTATQINVDGDYCSLANINIKSGGNVILSGHYMTVSDLIVRNSASAETFAVNSSGDYARLSNVIVENTDDDVGGITITGAGASLVNSAVNNIGDGGGNTADGISVPGTNRTVAGCRIGTVNGTGVGINPHATAIIKNNVGFVTENKGTGQIDSGTTADVITHGLAYTPSAQEISITFTEDPTNSPGAIWVDTITSTQFTVNCENDPGASNFNFGWRAER
jgi:hypothetical protein